MRLAFLLASLPLLGVTEVSVCASGCTYTSLQTAVDAAQTYQDGTLCEDVLVTLTAGETFSGNFVFPNKSCAKYVTIESSLHRTLPQGQRAGSSHTALMALIRTPNQTAAIDISTGGYWRFRMVEVTKAATGALLYPLVSVLNSAAKQLTETPHHVIFDRVYMHGIANDDEVIRGLSLGGRNIEVIDSTISEIMGLGIETQAIWCGGGCTEIVVTNSLISAATENFLSGGNDGLGLSQYAIGHHPQTGMTFRGNYFWKDPAWKRSSGAGAPSAACLVGELRLDTVGSQWYVCTAASGTWNTTSAPVYASTPGEKNLFELKDGRRVRVLGNYFANSWDQAQPGSIYLVNQTGQTSMAYNVEDLEFSYNRGDWIGAGFNYGNLGYLWTPGNGYVGTSITKASRHATVSNLATNHFYGGAGTGGSGRMVTLHTVGEMLFRHNTFAGQATHGVVNNSDVADNWTGNIGVLDNAFGTTFPTYGWIGQGSVGGSNWCALQNLVIDAGGSLDFRSQALVAGSTVSTTCTGDSGSQLYSGTLPAAASDLFTNASSDWTIKTGSPAENAATDGTDIGADIAMVDGATSTVVAGTLSDWHKFQVRGLLATATGGTLYYSAPTTSACTVDMSTSEAFGSTTGSVSQSRVGLAAVVTLSGLSASAPYWWRVTCGSYSYRGRFLTTT